MHVRLDAAFTVVAAVLLSGCAGATPGAAPSQTAPVSDVGVVAGIVTSDELVPVVGAAVALDGAPMAATDAGGRFSLESTPGLHVLGFDATGYEPQTQEVEVILEGLVEVAVRLKGIPGQSPYSLTFFFEGFDACSYTAVYTGSSTNGYADCPFGESKDGFRADVADGWSVGVHEMHWPGSEEMTFLSSMSANGCRTASPPARPADWCPAFLWGKSPLRALAQPNDIEYAKKYSLNGTQTWPEGNYTSHLFGGYLGFFRSEINETAYPACAEVNRRNNIPEHWGCPLGIGYSTGIRFTIYHTTFYYGAPLNWRDYSAVPDG